MANDPVAELIRNAPPEIVRGVTVQIDADTVTVTQVYDRAAYERYAADRERANAGRRHTPRAIALVRRTSPIMSADSKSSPAMAVTHSAEYPSWPMMVGLPASDTSPSISRCSASKK